MTCILLSTDNPYFNLAAEEFFLKNSNEEFFLLYINKPCVVAGRHQNLYAEINHRYVLENDILTARRITGGGTVYHDYGNLNFVFISNLSQGHLSAQKKYTAIMADALQSMNIPATPGTRNEILVNGKKVSGCAEHVYKNRLLHHGTLLFSSDLDKLKKALSVTNQYSHKAVKSVASEVINLKNLLPTTMDMAGFIQKISDFLHANNYIKSFRNIKLSESSEIIKLQRIKYSCWDWIVSSSPRYEIKTNYSFHNKQIKISATIEKGRIFSVSLVSADFSDDLLINIQRVLAGIKLDIDEIKKQLEKFNKDIAVNDFFHCLL